MLTRRLAGCLAALITALVIAPAASADSTPNTFKTFCSPVTLGPFANPLDPQQMDPIVYPGQYPAGHLHEFFGSTQITPSSDGFQLQADSAAAHTTCVDRFDTAAYWVPTVYKNGVRVPPISVDVYYQRIPRLTDSTGTPLDSVVEPPTDLRMVSGNHDAVSPQPGYIHWTCLGGGTQGAIAPPACPDHEIGGMVNFPSCWDGAGDHQANNTSNVAFASISGRVKQCPAGFGVQIPRLLLTIHYPADPLPDCHLVPAPAPAVNCDTYTLSENVGGALDDQGSIFGYHADFLNGWNDGPDTADPQPEDFASLIARCDNAPSGTPGCNVQFTTPRGDSS